MRIKRTQPALPVDLREAAVWPRQKLRTAVEHAWIAADAAILDRQLQPASIDLRLGAKAFRVRSSFLPGDASVEARLESLGMYELPLDREDGAILERGHVYVIPLLERLELPKGTRGKANPKSTTGRLDVLTRLITDRNWRFDEVPSEYAGRLYVEIVPSSFTIRVRSGMSLNQLRLMHGNPHLSDEEIEDLNDARRLVVGPMGGRREAVIERGLYLGVDLQGRGTGGLIGYRARKNSAVIDLSRLNHYEPLDFWEELRSRDGRGRLILEPEEFLILSSKEKVQVPPEFAAEMVAYDVTNGELRTHYAGFFDPGFGHRPDQPNNPGTRAVLEVRAHEVPFLLEDGQLFCKLVYERLIAPPDLAYGAALDSSYQDQDLTLSKQFRRAASARGADGE